MLITVSPHHQKNGVGTQLLRGIIQFAFELGFHRMWLSVDKTNFVAIHLYTKCGFERLTFTESPQLEMALDLKRYHPTAQLKVKAVMNRTVIAVNQEVSCREAVELFLGNNVGALPVVNDAREVVGILSQTDLMFKPQLRHKVSEVATRQVVTMHQDCTVEKAIRLFQSRKLRCIPVVDRNKRLVGILARQDLLAYYFKNYHLFAAP
jgi:CBS domain-containing protein